MDMESKNMQLSFAPHLSLPPCPYISPARCTRCRPRPHATPQAVVRDTPQPLSRRAALRLGAVCTIATVLHAPPSIAVDANALRAARGALDKIDALIDDARWDSVRTLLAGPAVRDGLQAARTAAEAAGPDTRGAWVGFREDALSAVKLLDAAVYSNVFIGEDRQILGTKIDFDTPRSYLADLKASFDEIVALADE